MTVCPHIPDDIVDHFEAVPPLIQSFCFSQDHAQIYISPTTSTIPDNGYKLQFSRLFPTVLVEHFQQILQRCGLTFGQNVAARVVMSVRPSCSAHVQCFWKVVRVSSGPCFLVAG